MAYDASNNQPDQNQVVSSTPLSGGQQPAGQPQSSDSQSAQTPSQPARPVNSGQRTCTLNQLVQMKSQHGVST